MPKAGPLAFVAAVTTFLGAAWYLRGSYLASDAPHASTIWPEATRESRESRRPGDAAGKWGGGRADLVPGAPPGLGRSSEARPDDRRSELLRQLDEVGTQIAVEEAYVRERSQELDQASDPAADERLRAERSDLEAALAAEPDAGPTPDADARAGVFARYAEEERGRAAARQQRWDAVEGARAELKQQEYRVEQLQAAIREQAATGVLTEDLRAMEERAPGEQARLNELRARAEALSREALAADELDDRQRRWEERADQQRLQEQAGKAAGASETRRRQQEARLAEIARLQNERLQQREALGNERDEARRRLEELQRRQEQLRGELEGAPPARRQAS